MKVWKKILIILGLIIFVGYFGIELYFYLNIYSIAYNLHALHNNDLRDNFIDDRLELLARFRWFLSIDIIGIWRPLKWVAVNAENPEIRSEAMSLIYSIKRKKAVPILKDILKNEIENRKSTHESRVTMIYSTAKHLADEGEYEYAFPFLMKAQEFATSAELQDKRALPYSRKALGSKDKSVQIDAAISLTQMYEKGDDIYAVLFNLLDEMWKEAKQNRTYELGVEGMFPMNCLSRLLDKRARPLLLDIIRNNKNSYDASEAIEALKEIESGKNAAEPYEIPERESDESPSLIGILNAGKTCNMIELLDSYQWHYKLINADQPLPASNKDMPMLIVPERGLTELDKNKSFMHSLQEYVSNGGRLIIFGQSPGHEYHLFPDSRRGFAWSDDQKCLSDFLFISTWHPMLSFFTTNTMRISTDGYLASFPENAIVVLVGAENRRAALIAYPLGQGLVIASTLHIDGKCGNNNAGEDDKYLIRSIVQWVKYGAGVTEIKSGNELHYSFAISYYDRGRIKATSARIVVFDPDEKTLFYRTEIPVNLKSGESTRISLTIKILEDAALGIYHTYYDLVGKEFSTLDSRRPFAGEYVNWSVQSQSEVPQARFLVSNPPAPVPHGEAVWFTVTASSLEAVYNETIHYAFYVHNDTDKTRKLRIKALLKKSNKTHEWIVKAEPKSELKIDAADQFPESNYSTEILQSFLYDESNKEIGSAFLVFSGTYNSLIVNSVFDKSCKIYSRGETVIINIVLINKMQALHHVKVKLQVRDCCQEILQEMSEIKEVLPYRTEIINTRFAIPANAKAGPYSAEIQYVVDEGIESQTVSYFHVKE